MDLTGNMVSNTVSLTLDSVSLSHLHPLSWHPGSSDHGSSPESSCMATDRSVTTMSCVFIGSQCFHPHPPPPRQVLVILLKCASEHQSSTQRLSISLRLQVLSRAHARDILLLFTWPMSTHLSMSFSEEGFPCPPDQVPVSYAHSRFTGMFSPTHITCLLPVGILCSGHRASCCLGEGLEDGQLAGKEASRGANGQLSKWTK